MLMEGESEIQEKRARLEWHFDDPVYGFMAYSGRNGVPSIAPSY